MRLIWIEQEGRYNDAFIGGVTFTLQQGLCSGCMTRWTDYCCFGVDFTVRASGRNYLIECNSLFNNDDKATTRPEVAGNFCPRGASMM